MRAFWPALLIAAAVFAGAAHAADEQGKSKPNIVAPPPPEALTKGEEIEPGVQIISRPWAEIREYSVNGRVYAVRIDPRTGPAYYLYDSNGDGRLNDRPPENLDAPDIHRWELLRW
ncbi:hypothetical protein KBTX_00444 [wastewater metagenome]|uniref:DUF2782 domain-containing protein n=2 Tax=unclassified sequences TaxID=12908 RepID=A0A5B8R6R7_9ZZZZ|nr:MULTISPECIES: DUF2782 domain-containing protein [Arhodomonas]MCS4504221.1 DUF2782 domain-containing protein [Arhodomonas aquaeolei]QEA04141.1 hypothetical protein KBTEX_00444 [uncultured organism]